MTVVNKISWQNKEIKFLYNLCGYFGPWNYVSVFPSFGPLVLCPAEFWINATFAPQTHWDLVLGAQITIKIPLLPLPWREKKDKKNPLLTFHLSPVTCHLSLVTCQVSHVICHLSHVTCHMSLQEQPQQQTLLFVTPPQCSSTKKLIFFGKTEKNLRKSNNSKTSRDMTKLAT